MPEAAQGMSLDFVLTIALVAALLLLGAAGWLLIRTERARSKLLALFARAEERAAAGETAATQLASARSEIDMLGRETASLTADVANGKERIGGLLRDVATAAEEQKLLREERDGLARTLATERAEIKGLERQIADLRDAKEQMRQSFGETANALLQQHSENFKKQNSEQIDHILKPLKNDIDAFKKSLTDAHVETSKQHGSLKEQIERLATQSASVSKEAENLTRALKGDVQMQGAWGEMIVDTILQRLGLREGVEFSRQESFSDAEGRSRTDFIINLPNGERLIIDSKVSLVDFEASANEASSETRAARLAAHARSMRAHVRTLASKDYQSRVGTRLDYVVMFVPIEAALGAALSTDETLTLDALDLKVAIATPTTLTTVMMTVASMWKVERQNRNADNIAARAGKLYDKFAGFMADLQKIGERIEQAQASYAGAINKLSGAGGLIRQAELLKAMGARSTKSLPQDLIASAGAEDIDVLLGLEDRSDAEATEEAPRETV